MADKSIEDRGMSIFLDVFRRADKDDDGFISWEEFIAFFADGVMGKEELRVLFNEIDTHNTGNIDTGELCSYFASHLGDFQQIYGTLEDLSAKVTNVLFSTSQSYEGADRKEKFVTRFLMRELQNQLSALQQPLEAASEELDLQARRERADIQPVDVEAMKKTGSTIPGRIVRRAKRQVSSQSTNSEGYGNQVLTLQVDRLENLIDKLESKVNFDNFVDEEVVSEPDCLMLMLQRNFEVKAEELDNFKSSLKLYVESIQGVGGCRNVSVRSFRDSNKLTVYEIWTSEADKKRSEESAASCTFMTDIASQLATPETGSSMTVPGSWWSQ
ncbi:N-terminal EF-hand calcium-binding protein 1-like isoform X2 [Haliotis rubra]|uniref:N-terminal EF-hand calcium-binding protein 1-like isoform X2 n=1 Tax=Haliotis rubra TaxID=36100 RepID=UPI001EE4F8BF|nr:N-terminal EF-hand calcium-binding protein 1-like isoform X2 [Haliotis rubra]